MLCSKEYDVIITFLVILLYWL